MSITTDRFTQAIMLILDLEGPDSDNLVTDPNGGLTRFGISQKQNPDVDVSGMTRDTAIAWYRANVWDAHRCGELAWPVCLVVFDELVNQGNGMPLQAALGVKQDGVIGPMTLAAAQAKEPMELAARTIEQRALRYVKSLEWPADGGGWMYRLARIAMAAGGP